MGNSMAHLCYSALTNFRHTVFAVWRFFLLRRIPVPAFPQRLNEKELLILPAALLFSRLLGAAGVFYAFPLTEIGSAVFSFWIYRRIWNRHR